MTAFVRFNIVGVIGFFVQLRVLAALHASGVPVLPATCLAVEAAILHNFVWHERWTWSGAAAGTRVARLARFHLANGFISIAGNAAITTALVGAGAPLLAANVGAVLTCALLNFAAAHLWVISTPPAHITRGGDPGCAKTWPTFHGHIQ